MRLIPETDQIGGMWPPSGVKLEKSDCDPDGLFLGNKLNILIMFKVTVSQKKIYKVNE